MSRRPGIIGAQTAAVALLVLIVYMTLLRPESDEPLRGISAPGQERVNVPEQHPRHDRERRVDRPEQRPRHRGDTGGGGNRTHTEVPPTGPASVGAAASVGGPSLPGAVNPARDQYGDAVESLLRKVASAAPPSPD
jgi:hypothetical protein